MDLTKKSVSDIEKKREYARICMRVLKDCKLVQRFKEYSETKDYETFQRRFAENHEGYTDIWYDKDCCGRIFGTCNFDSFLEKYGKRKDREDVYCPYYLLLCYLALFDEREFTKYYSLQNEDKGKTIHSEKFINEMLNHVNDPYSMRFSTKDKEMVKKWLMEKEALYGSKN